MNTQRSDRLENLSKTKSTLLLVVLLTLIFVLLYMAAELLVRTRMYVKYGNFWSYDIKQLDADTGLMLPRENYESGTIRINSMGFRSPEIISPKPEDTLRLAFLGGSTTFCQEVSSNELVWPAVLTNALKEHYGGTEIDHVNASATALSVGDSLINMQRRVAPLQPDMVVIYHAVNDLALNGATLARQQGLEISVNPINPVLNKIINTSLLAELVYKNLLIISKSKKAESNIGKVDYDDEFMRNQFRDDLKALVDDALKTASLVVIPTFSNHLRRDQSKEKQAEAASTHLFHIPFFELSDLLTAFESYNDVIREFSIYPNVLIIETEQEIEGTSENFIDSVHFTDAGSERLGKYLAKSLIESEKFNTLGQLRK